jgi:hypothetical protein
MGQPQGAYWDELNAKDSLGYWRPMELRRHTRQIASTQAIELDQPRLPSITSPESTSGRLQLSTK